MLTRSKINFVPVNKKSILTWQWEIVYLCMGDNLFKFFYKNYMIFLKTKDDSLVQISGENIFIFINYKFGLTNKTIPENIQIKSKFTKY